MSKENYSVDRLKKSLLYIWTDIKNTRWVIIFIIAYFVFLRKYLYSTCPMVVIIGFPCPMCGMTRAGFALLRFDFRGALQIHPFIYPISGLIIIFCFNRYILFRKTPEWMKWILILLIIAMVGFYIWRMYRYFPGEPPMSYYYDNMTHRFVCLIKRFL